MTDYMDFWWSKFLVDLSIVGGLGLLCVLVAVALTARITIKQKLCKHERYRENMSCHAICLKCAKDMGFIQNIREKNPRGEV